MRVKYILDVLVRPGNDGKSVVLVHQPSQVLRITLRQMAWERAKGELRSMLQTFWGETKDYEWVKLLIDKFIHEAEDASCLG